MGPARFYMRATPYIKGDKGRTQEIRDTRKEGHGNGENWIWENKQRDERHGKRGTGGWEKEKEGQGDGRK